MKNVLIRRCKKYLLRTLHEVSGTAAIEFAYIAPLLMLMTFGTFEMTRALVAHKRFQRAAAMVGDLVAREEQLGATPSEAVSALDGVMRSAQSIMTPYSMTPLRVAITQLRASSSDATVTKVEWAYPYNSAPTTACGQTKAMPATGMVTAGNAAIIVEATYQYTPLLNNIIPGLITTMNWSDTMAYVPRWGSVFYGQATQNTKCPAGTG
jgi:Flp pilus assembly protein TadG